MKDRSACSSSASSGDWVGAGVAAAGAVRAGVGCAACCGVSNALPGRCQMPYSVVSSQVSASAPTTQTTMMILRIRILRFFVRLD